MDLQVEKKHLKYSGIIDQIILYLDERNDCEMHTVHYGES